MSYLQGKLRELKLKETWGAWESHIRETWAKKMKVASSLAQQRQIGRSCAIILFKNCSYTKPDTWRFAQPQTVQWNTTCIFLSDEIFTNQFFLHVLINFSNNHVCERVLPGCDRLQSRWEQAEGDKCRLQFPHQGVRHQEGKVHIILDD